MFYHRKAAIKILQTSCSSSYSTYAFIGLGKMGHPMSLNLRKNLPSSAKVLVYDTNPASTASPVQGVTVAKSLREIGESAEVVITMLPNSEHVEACYFGDSGFCFQQPGVLSSSFTPAKTRLFIDCSTIDPFRSIAIGDHCKSKQFGTFVDAPVSGGVTGAQNGTLSFMIGHAPGGESTQAIQAVLKTMGATLHFCGERGSGLAAKLTNNYLLALNNLATAEAMRLGLKMGLEAKTLGAVINSSTGKCWPSEKNNPVQGISPGAPAERNFDGGFGIELMIKDLGLAMDAAKGTGVQLPSADAAMAMYRRASESFAGKDFGVVMKYLDRVQIEAGH